MLSAEEVCAFANAAGGVLLIGIDDNNTIVGVTISNAQRSAIQNSLNEISPSLQCNFSEVIVDGLSVGVIEVPSGSQKPYTLSGAIYIRQGPNSQKIVSAELMRDFFQQSDRIYFDEGVCKEFIVHSDLDTIFFEEFRINSGISKGVSQEQIIKNLNLTNEDGFIKKGGVLFFGKQPEVFFDKAVVRCLAFELNNKTNIIDDKVFGGPLMYQYQQAMQWLKGKLSVRYEIHGGGPRKETWEIPETVFKEAIINALTHRDYYDKGARITIELFPDRVEIVNPGGLVSAIPPEEFGFRSHSRNPLLFGLFERMDMVEQVGSGIGRIQDDMKSAELPEPVFNTKGMFSVIFHRRVQEKTREKTREKIVRLVQINNTITTKELAEIIGVSEKGIEFHISRLKSENILKRVGPDKGGHWEIIGK